MLQQLDQYWLDKSQLDIETREWLMYSWMLQSQLRVFDVESPEGIVWGHIGAQLSSLLCYHRAAGVDLVER